MIGVVVMSCCPVRGFLSKGYDMCAREGDLRGYRFLVVSNISQLPTDHTTTHSRKIDNEIIANSNIDGTN